MSELKLVTHLLPRESSVAFLCALILMYVLLQCCIELELCESYWIFSLGIICCFLFNSFKCFYNVLHITSKTTNECRFKALQICNFIGEQMTLWKIRKKISNLNKKNVQWWKHRILAPVFSYFLIYSHISRKHW